MKIGGSLFSVLKYSITLNQQFRAAPRGPAKFHELVASSSNSMKFLTPAPSALFPEIAENRSTEYFLRIHQCGRVDEHAERILRKCRLRAGGQPARLTHRADRLQGLRIADGAPGHSDHTGAKYP
jgi:hypothetical protein